MIYDPVEVGRYTDSIHEVLYSGTLSSPGESHGRAGLPRRPARLGAGRRRVQGPTPAHPQKLPAGLARLLDSVYLHDARVVDMWQGRRSRFTVTLLPESAPGRFVILAYSLLEAPRFAYGVLPAEVHSQPLGWLYDELDVEQGAATSNARLGGV